MSINNNKNRSNSRKRKDDITCYRCQQRGHASDFCQVQTNNYRGVPIRNNIPIGESCYNCNKNGFHDTACMYYNNNNRSSPQVENTKTYKISVKLDGPWGKAETAKSALLHHECDAFKIKRLVIQALFDAKFIQESDMDVRNQLPHVELRKSSSDPWNDIYKTWEDVKDVSCTLGIHKDYIELQLSGNKHISLFYAKKLFDKDEAKLIVLNVLKAYEEKKEVKEGEQNSSSSSSSSSIYQPDECVVCMDEARSCVFQPCLHRCTCKGCANRMTFCPICKAPIKDRVFPINA